MAGIELVISAFLLLTFIAALISLRLKVPYTLVLVFTGVLIAIIAASLTLQGSPIQNPMQSFVLQIKSIYSSLVQGGGGGLFVGLVVPPLIFEAMIHIRGSDLRSVIKPSLALATIGVLIATKEFTERLEEGKMEIDQLIAQSRVTVETKKIIQARASKLFPSLPKKTKPKQKNEEDKEV